MGFGDDYQVKKKDPKPGEEGQLYAMKKLKPQYDPDLYVREVRVFASLSHPTILGFRGFSITSPAILVTDFLSGKDVYKLIQLEHNGMSEWNETDKCMELQKVYVIFILKMFFMVILNQIIFFWMKIIIHILLILDYQNSGQEVKVNQMIMAPELFEVKPIVINQLMYMHMK